MVRVTGVRVQDLASLMSSNVIHSPCGAGSSGPAMGPSLCLLLLHGPVTHFIVLYRMTTRPVSRFVPSTVNTSVIGLFFWPDFSGGIYIERTVSTPVCPSLLHRLPNVSSQRVP